MPWVPETSPLFEYYRLLSAWISDNQLLSVVLAVALPMLLLWLRSVRHRRLRFLQVEEEKAMAKQQHRLPQETIERNRREERRYKESLKQKQRESKKSRW